MTGGVFTLGKCCLRHNIPKDFRRAIERVPFLPSEINKATFSEELNSIENGTKSHYKIFA